MPGLLDAPIVDFLIITALEEERDAVVSKLPDAVLLPPSTEHIQRYYLADLPVTLSDGSTGMYRVVVMSLLSMGRVTAATATKDAINQWHPRYILLVGIAGGVPERKVRLGDLLISTQIVDYELQKLTEKGAEFRWEIYRADAQLLNAVRTFSADIYSELITVAAPRRVKTTRHVGPVASGDKVVAFKSFMQFYREKGPALLGVEMEAGGVAAAAFQLPIPPGFLMIRGVSDLADSNKDSRRMNKVRHYACDVAAAYAIALLKKGPVPFSAGRKDESNGVLWQQFGAILEEKVENFIGRDYVLEDIDTFIAANPNGYFTLEGYPGEGNSTLLAKYVPATRRIAYFNMRSQSMSTPQQFLESICRQLIQRYKLNISTPEDATQNGAFLLRLLNEASKKLKDTEKLVIEIDALEEVEQPGSDVNIPFLPPVLPKNVYFILTSRSLAGLPVVVQTTHRIRELTHGRGHNLNEIKLYISNAARRASLSTWLLANNLSRDEFVEKMAFLSESNFIYLYHVLPAIEGGLYRELSIDVLPKGLEAFFHDYRRIGVNSKPRLDHKIRVVYILSEVW